MYRLGSIALSFAICGWALTAHGSLVLQPPGLNAGQQYRLVFITSGTIAATSSNIADYNSFVQTAADNVPALNALGATWSVIASAGTVNARTNTNSIPSFAGGSLGVPIYLLDGGKVADSYDDLWDSTIDTPLNFTETGSTYPNFTAVWTGSLSDGQSAGGLGTGGATWFGYSHGTTFGTWMAVTIDFSPSTPRPVYAMSSVLTAVPEISSFSCMLVVSICIVTSAVLRSKFARRTTLAAAG